MAKYIVLTNRDEYQTSLNNEGLRLIETYEYYFFNQLRAKYTVAEVIGDDIKITLTEEKNGVTYVNHIPIKFFEGYDSVEAAREELEELSGPNSDDSRLERIAIAHA
ncbi:hypothetical protein [Bacillus sp. FJAT-45350]|uniref:hypothetical protein n=1 Tax=Bacillus sp. FJAT-45350 TaxID=2011014 RepID=UPI000BB6C906|nr:hypothetical protein [Bacillus sp. FJAT-45350]